MSNYKDLINNSDVVFANSKSNSISLKRLNEIVNDQSYISFIDKICNGGYFYDRALQIYSIKTDKEYNNIFRINQVIADEYKEIVEGIFFFAQEIFSNQFGFSKEGIVFFNIETGEKEVVANNFDEWVDVILDDISYYTGQNISREWKEKGGLLELNMRLCPTKPFIIGGEYEVDNLSSQTFPGYISSNANIARQIYNLPDGTPVRLKITE
ncbi:SMI1/KNR4 family protein [Mucilaginibacter rubeus]|uniref:SMI1/KNR4 family protein n=1 Tax=Mucilaginibacter rubeus TaxID=2027860 RepID=A0A5C1HWF0_9SPHI|nr:SMI1/KNR4 family protein [Mucilaginibacter rubeus]QEM09138.1 SMI1/KNR4 family protein [Mucilaginibacter rubeus]